MRHDALTRPNFGLGALLLAGVCALCFGACAEEPARGEYDGALTPVTAESPYFSRFQLVAVAPGTPSAFSITPAELERRAIAHIDGAKKTCDAAFAHLASKPLREALQRAQARGVVVRVVTDVDSAQEPELLALAEGTPPIPVVAGDGPLDWNPQPTLDVARSGDDNRMTHNFLRVDRTRLLITSGGFGADREQAAQLAVFAISEELGVDFGEAFDQMAGGVFADSLTFYGASVASDSNPRTFYPTEGATVAAWFGPSEPGMKQLVDELYSATGSIELASEELANTPVVSALAYKAEAGFPVRVLVAATAETARFSRVAALKDRFARITARKPGTNATVRVLPPGLALKGTLAVLNDQPSPLTGLPAQPLALWSSTAAVESIPFVQQGDGSTISRPSDGFTDAVLFAVFASSPTQRGSDWQNAKSAFDALWEQGK